jgi:hypothetical protein
MRNRKRSKGPGYVVGYGRPPKATQFKAGESGNSRGRPKGPRSVGAVLRDVIQQRIAVTENGKTRRIPALEVMLRRLANDAMRNDAKAMRLLLSLIYQYAEAPESDHRLDEVLAEDQAILSRYLREPAELASDPDKRSKKKRGADDI